MKKTSFLFLSILIFLQAALQAHGAPDPRIIPVVTKQPDERRIYPIAIIGAGAAGTMAVQRAVLNNTEVLLFTGAKSEQKHSRGNWVRKVDNVPGLAKYERTVLELRNEVLKELFESKLSDNLYVIQESVKSIAKGTDFFKLTDGLGRTYYAKYVVMATGIMNEQPHIQGSIRPILKYANGQTIAYCSLCDGHRSFGKKTVVIGHADCAAYTAIALSEKYQIANLCILTNGQIPAFETQLFKRIQEKSIAILEAPIHEILGDEDQRQLTGFKLSNGEIIEAEIGFVSLGIRPNNELALQLGTQVDTSGLVITDPNGESSVPNLFVVGDLRANSMKQIYTAWQQAVDSVQLINRRLNK